MPVVHRGLPSLLLILACASTRIQQPQLPAPTPDVVTTVSDSERRPALPAGDVTALYQELRALRLDAGLVYQVQDLHLRRGPVSLSLTQGRLAFYAPIRGRITGAVFTGAGRVILLPRQPSEKLSLLRFVGVPLLDQGFSRAYLRFTGDTADSLRRQLMEQGATGVPDASFSDPWNAVLGNLGSWQSLRVLSDLLAQQPRPFFYAGLSGGPIGAFDVLVDPRRQEPVLVGQTELANGIPHYDVWTSLLSTQPGVAEWSDFQPSSYAVTTTIHEDHSLDGETILKIHCVRPEERILPLHLAPELHASQIVQQAAGGASQPLTFFQSAQFDSHGATSGAGGDVLVALAQPSIAGGEYELRVSYHGTVISDAGNGVLFVAERGSWYASLPGPDRFSPFELSFRWPRQLTLVAPGMQVEEHAEGEMRTARWIIPQPVSVAGFNLGEYVRHTVKGGSTDSSIQVDVYANRQLEEAIAQRIATANGTISEFMGNAPTPPEFNSEKNAPVLAPGSHLPNPTAALSLLGGKILDSIGFLEKWNGPFPFDRLAIVQIPGSFGQGWPGLIYLPTLAFLPSQAQQQAGAVRQAQEELSQLVPYHEVAHQWWGNTVGVDSYRDTWILEAMANYLALMYSDSRQPAAHVMDNWLESFRQQLTAVIPGSGDSKESVESVGPLSLGYRLQSPQAPTAYDSILYGKGTWVIHMLRMMLRGSNARAAEGATETSADAVMSDKESPSSGAQGGHTQDPDFRFEAVLRDLLEQHRFQAISTADLQHAVENHMTPAMDLEGGHRMDWFFDEYVGQTGLPEYRIEFQTRVFTDGKIQIRGTLFQDGVSDTFTLPVPLYAASPRPSGGIVGHQIGSDESNHSKVGTNGKLVSLGDVVTNGPETKFQFWLLPVARAPHSVSGSTSGSSGGFGRTALRLYIDPNHTLLCLIK